MLQIESVCMLTAMLLLIHTRAGTVQAATVVGAIWGHWGQQGITCGYWRQGVPYKFFHFTGPGGSIAIRIPGVCRNLVEGDGAIVEVQCGRRWHVRSRAVLVEVCWAVAEGGFLFNGSANQIWCTDRWGWNHCKTMSTGLDLQLLDDYKKNMI